MKGSLLTSIEGPNDSQVHRLVFSQDGRFLAVTHNSQKVDIWDLSLIHRRLREIGLDAGFPDNFGGDTRAGEVATIDRIEVRGADAAGLRLLAARRTLREAAVSFRQMFEPDLTDPEELRQRGIAWWRLGFVRLATADHRASLSRRPDSATTANSLAWNLVASPGRGDPDEAVRWARKAVELEPLPGYRNTLGTALYRAGQLSQAAVELERNVAENSPSIGFDHVVLAMCRQRMGRPDSARLELIRARRWQASVSLRDSMEAQELRDLIREAEALLNGSLPDFPPSIFSP